MVNKNIVVFWFRFPEKNHAEIGKLRADFGNFKMGGIINLSVKMTSFVNFKPFLTLLPQIQFKTFHKFYCCFFRRVSKWSWAWINLSFFSNPALLCFPSHLALAWYYGKSGLQGRIWNSNKTECFWNPKYETSTE